MYSHKFSKYLITDVSYYFFQLEKAKKKEAAFIVTVAKREQEISELKVISLFKVCCAYKLF